MANTLTIKIDGDTKGLESKLKNIGSSAEKAFSSFGTSATNVGKTMSTHVTAPVVAAGLAGVKFATDFETGMAKVGTIADTNVKSVDELSTGVRDLSKSTGKSQTELAEALYQTLSATNDTGNALGYLEQGTRLAIGGFTDTTTAIDGVTSVMNAYGLTGEEAFKKVADNMITTQNLGKTTAGELSQSLYNVIPTAASLGVSFDEVSAAMATITSQGTPTSVATTQLRQMFVELSKDGSKTSKVFTDMAGKSFKQFIAEGGTVEQALALLSKAAQQNGVELKDMFGSVEAGNAAMQLTGMGAAKFNESLASMSSSAGATETAFTKMSDTSAFKFEQTKTKLIDAAIQIGEILMPMVMKIVDKVQEWVNWFNNLDEGTQKTIVKIALFAAAIGPVLIVVGKISTGIGALIKIFSGLSSAAGLLSSAIGFICSPAGLVVAAIAAIIAIGVLLWKNWDTVKEYAIKIWNAIKDFFAGIWEGIKKAAEAVWEGLKSFFTAIWNAIKVVVESIWNGIKDFLSGLWNKIKEIATNVWNNIKDFLSGLWNGIKNTVVNVWNSIRDFLSNLWNKIKEVATNIWNSIKDFISGIWNGIKKVTENVWNGIKDFLNKLWSGIKDTATKIWDGLKNFLSGLWDNIKNTISNVWNGIKDFFTGIWNNIVSGAWDGLKNLGSTIWDCLQGVVSGMWEIGKNIVNGLWEGIKGAGTWLYDKVSGFFGGIVDKAKGIFGIHSPSTVFDYIATMDVKGFGRGWDREFPKVERLIGANLSGMIDNIKSKNLRITPTIAPGINGSGKSGNVYNNNNTNKKVINQNFYTPVSSPFDAYRRAAFNT